MHELLRTSRAAGLVASFEEGRLLPDTAALALENEISRNPTDVETRARLLGLYLLPREDRPGPDPEKSYRSHLLWIVENLPNDALGPSCSYALLPEEDPELFKELDALWCKNLEQNANDFDVFFNAVVFYEGACAYERALEVALLASSLKGKDAVVDGKIKFLKKHIREFPKEGAWKDKTE